MNPDETSLVILIVLAAFVLLGGVSLMVACLRSSLSRDSSINEATQKEDEVKHSVSHNDEDEIQVRVYIQIFAGCQCEAEDEKAGRERHDGKSPTFKARHKFSTDKKTL